METFRMVQLFDTSNSVDDGPSYGTRQGAWQHTFPFSPRYAAKYCQDAPSMYAYRSASFGGSLILQQLLSAFSPSDKAVAARAISEFKRLRVFWQDTKARVHHLLAPAFPPSNFPPWLPEFRDDITGGGGWDSMQVMSGDSKSGAAFVFRAQGGPAQLRSKSTRLNSSHLGISRMPSSA